MGVQGLQGSGYSPWVTGEEIGGVLLGTYSYILLILAEDSVFLELSSLS